MPAGHRELEADHAPYPLGHCGACFVAALDELCPTVGLGRSGPFGSAVPAAEAACSRARSRRSGPGVEAEVDLDQLGGDRRARASRARAAATASPRRFAAAVHGQPWPRARPPPPRTPATSSGRHRHGTGRRPRCCVVVPVARQARRGTPRRCPRRPPVREALILSSAAPAAAARVAFWSQPEKRAAISTRDAPEGDVETAGRPRPLPAPGSPRPTAVQEGAELAPAAGQKRPTVRTLCASMWRRPRK